MLDVGLLPYRELDDVLALTAVAESLLYDWRTGQQGIFTKFDGPGAPGSARSYPGNPGLLLYLSTKTG